jgi:hypothetical protein
VTSSRDAEPRSSIFAVTFLTPIRLRAPLNGVLHHMWCWRVIIPSEQIVSKSKRYLLYEIIFNEIYYSSAERSESPSEALG